MNDYIRPDVYLLEFLSKRGIGVYELVDEILIFLSDEKDMMNLGNKSGKIWMFLNDLEKEGFIKCELIPFKRGFHVKVAIQSPGISYLENIKYKNVYSLFSDESFNAEHNKITASKRRRKHIKIYSKLLKVTAAIATIIGCIVSFKNCH